MFFNKKGCCGMNCGCMHNQCGMGMPMMQESCPIYERPIQKCIEKDIVHEVQHDCMQK